MNITIITSIFLLGVWLVAFLLFLNSINKEGKRMSQINKEGKYVTEGELLDMLNDKEGYLERDREGKE